MTTGGEPDRAVAVVVRDGRLLVIDRYLRQEDAVDCVMCGYADARRAGRCPGHRYTVLPGGGVEPDETSTEAAERELAEEATLTATAGRLLWSGEHNGRSASYFEMLHVDGEAELGGEERLDHGPRNSYRLVWVTVTELQARSFHPPEILSRLAGHLRSGTRHD